MTETAQRKTLSPQVENMIRSELENIPEKYARTDFNSIHEGYAVILEEVRELEQEVFFGEKKAVKIVELSEGVLRMSDQERNSAAVFLHKERMREECVQIAAMCVRFIQELT